MRRSKQDVKYRLKLMVRGYFLMRISDSLNTLPTTLSSRFGCLLRATENILVPRLLMGSIDSLEKVTRYHKLS